MDLFNHDTGSGRNLLPRDGIVHYYGPVFSAAEAEQYFKTLLENIDWKHDEAIIYGKRIVTARKVAWYGDRPFAYTYSNTTKQALPWTPVLLALKAHAEAVSGENFNSCLLNLYHSGAEGMAWHSDAEKALEKDGPIASLSFGAARTFAFRHKETRETISLILDPGSLLLMKGITQTHWLHRLPPTKRVMRARVSLTFRRVVA